MTSTIPARDEAVTPVASESVTPAEILRDLLRHSYARQDVLTSLVLRLQRELGHAEGLLRQALPYVNEDPNEPGGLVERITKALA